jgi:hypothetical protein
MYITTQHCTLQHCTLQHCTLQHCTLQHCILQHCLSYIIFIDTCFDIFCAILRELHNLMYCNTFLKVSQDDTDFFILIHVPCIFYHLCYELPVDDTTVSKHVGVE